MADEKKTYSDRFARTWNGPFPFSPDQFGQISTNATGVYELLSPSGSEWKVVYVGIGVIRTRLRNHYAGRGNWALGRMERPEELRFIYIICDGVTAQNVESHMVTYAKPVFNTRPEYKELMQSISIH